MKITYRLAGRVFERLDNSTTLTFSYSFDGIIGDDTLKNLKALVDRNNNCLIISPGIKIPRLAKRFLTVNSLLDSEHPNEVRQTLIDEYSHLLDPLSPGEAFDTSVRAEIRTNIADPIYTKIYPYPASMRFEVDREIENS